MFECDKRWRETVQESRMVSVRGAHALIDDLIYDGFEPQAVWRLVWLDI